MMNTLKTTCMYHKKAQNGIYASLSSTTKSFCVFSQQQRFSSFLKKAAGKDTLNKKKNFFFSAKELFLQNVVEGSSLYYQKKHVRSQIKDHRISAELLFSQGKYREALKNYKTAQNLLRRCFEEDYSDLADFNERIGDLYYTMNESEEALNNYQESLKYAVKDKKKDNRRLHFRIGLCYFQENNYSQAIFYLKEALNFNLKNIKSDLSDDIIISCNNMLSECYINYSQYDRALNHLQKANKVMLIDNAARTADHNRFAECSLNYGLSLAYVTKEFHTALNLMRKYQNQQIQESGEDSFGAGISYLKIGEVYSLQQKYTRALANFNKALAIFQKDDKTDRNIGMCYKAIGQVYGLQKDYKGCIELTTKGLKHLEGDSSLSECYRNIAFAYSGLNEYDKALENLKKSAYTREKALEGLEDADLEFLVLNGLLAGAHFDEKEYSEASECVELFLKELCKFVYGESQEKLRSRKLMSI